MSKSLVSQNMEIAFRVYASTGGNVGATLKELRRQGLKLSESTFYEWAASCNFASRLREADVSVVLLARFHGDPLRAILSDLVLQADRYKALVVKNPTDLNAHYAWLSCLRLASAILKRLPKDDESAEPLTPEEMREMAASIFEAEYGIKRECAPR